MLGPMTYGVLSIPTEAGPAFLDTFTDTNATPLASHTPDSDQSGNGWTESAGTWEIQSNRLSATGSLPAPGWLATFSGGSADGTLEAIVNIPVLGTHGIVFRYTDNSNFWMAIIRVGFVQLYKREAASFTQVASADADVVVETDYTLKVVLDGADIEVFLDGASMIVQNNSFQQTATVHGFRSGDDRAQFDDVSFFFDGVVSPSVSILSPAQYTIKQRDGSDQASITVSGTYSGGAPTAIEYQLDGGAWATLDATPGAGTFSGAISAVGIGEHTIGVRWANSTGTTHSVSNVRVGDVFGWIGQSNQGGRLTNAQSYTGAAASVFDEDGSWKDLASGYQTPGAADFSVLPLLASLIETQTGAPVGFVCETAGGTGLVTPDDEWASGGVNYEAFVASVAASGANDLAAFLWYQGEHDVVAGIAEATYQAAEAAMLDSLQTDTGFSAPMISANIAYMGASADADINAIRAAKIANWGSDADIHPGPTGHDQSFSDNLHWQTDTEAQALANRWWRTIHAALFGGTEAARGPQFSSVVRSGTTVTVTLTGGEGNLANQTDETGFRFTDDGTPITITGAIANGTNAVDLTLNSTPSGTELISFGSGNDGAGATLVDSGTYPLPPEPFIDEGVT